MMIQGMPATTWLLETRSGKLAMWCIERTAFLVGALLMLWAVYMVETRFIPVIDKWRLDYVDREGDHYVMGGVMHKQRACELIATSIMAVPAQRFAPRILIYQIKPHELNGGNAPTGYSTWGPWRLAIPQTFLDQREHISFLEVVGHHRCHGFWTQETLYGRVSVEMLP